MQQHTPIKRTSITSPQALSALFFAIGCFLLFWNLGGGSLYPWDESLSAMRALHMYEDGLSLVVRTMGEPDFNKPPLYYWLAAGAFHLFGPGLFALRLPGVLFGVGCLACAFLLGRAVCRSLALSHDKSASSDAAAWGGCLALACLALNPHWLNIVRVGMLEAGVGFSLIASVLWGCYGRGRHTALGGVALGLLLGICAWIKYPFIGALLPFFYLYWRFCDNAEDASPSGKRPVRPSRPFFWALATFLVVGCGWYTASLIFWGRDFWNFYFDYNAMKRAVHGVEGHSEGFFFLIEAAFRYAPLSFMAFLSSLPALRAAWKRGNRRAALPVAVAWLFLLMLSMMVGKRKIYIVSWYPLFSACAAFGTMWLIDSLVRGAGKNLWERGKSAGRTFLAERLRLSSKGRATLGVTLVCAYAVAMVGVTYRIAPDYSQDESAVYRQVRNILPEEAVIMSNADAPAVGWFELGRIDPVVHVDSVNSNFFQSAFQKALDGKQVSLILEEHKRRPGERRTLFNSVARNFPQVEIKVLASQGRFFAVLLTMSQPKS